MKRRAFIAGSSAALGSAIMTQVARIAPAVEPESNALAAHRAVGVFDAYTKPVLKVTRAGFEPGQFIERVETMQAGLWRLRDGHVRIANMSVGVPRYQVPAAAGERPTSKPICTAEEETRMVLRQLDAIYRSAEQRPGELGIARTVAESERLNAAGKLALFLHLTGAWIADDLAVLRMYRQVGVVAIHPCVEGHPRMGDSANEPSRPGGLTELGRQVVKEMNRLNMVVDVAHGSDASIRDMVETSGAPTIYSHGACATLCDNPRNITDERIRQIAAKGGVVCIAFVSAMLSNQARQSGGRADPAFLQEVARSDSELHDRQASPYAYLEERSNGTFMPSVYRRLGWPEGGRAAAASNRAGIDDVVEHIMHVAKIAGIDHVGIGTDYESGDVPNDLEHAGKLPNLTTALLRRGLTEPDVRKVLTENMKRVYRTVLDRPANARQ